MTAARPSRTPLDVLVIGAGQAGLAVGHHLARRGLRFVIVDAAPEIGHSWRSRWDSLRLFTPAEYDGLPGMPFPAEDGTYPGKDAVADYLRAYADRFELPVVTGTRVERLARDEGGLFEVTTGQGTLAARQVVVATGPFQRPRIPEIAASLDDSVTQLHSSAYLNPAGLPDGKVLVVGAGNSGLQIALELAAAREVHVAAGRPQRMVSQRPLGRDLFWWLTRTGLVTRPASSPLAKAFRARGGDLVIGTTWADVDAAGIARRPRVTDARGDRVRFADGTVLDDLGTVVWATGFRPDYSWLDVPGVWDGTALRHTRGRTSAPGLWFVGLPWQHTRGSALLGFVGEDAAWVAHEVTLRHRTTWHHHPQHHPVTHHQKEHPMSSTEHTYRVAGMTCGHCVAAVEREIGSLDGVSQVSVDLETGGVVVTSARPLTHDEVTEAVDEAGYQLVC